MKKHYITRYLPRDLRYNWILSKLENEKGKIILDLGCGNSPFSKILSKQNQFISLNLGYNKLLNITHGSKLQANGNQLPFKNNTIDITICTEVIEHMENPKQLINEINRTTKEKIIITTPNTNYPTIWDITNKIRQKLNKKPKTKPVFTNWTKNHKKLYTPQELQELTNAQQYRLYLLGKNRTAITSKIWYLIYPLNRIIPLHKLITITTKPTNRETSITSAIEIYKKAK